MVHESYQTVTTMGVRRLYHYQRFDLVHLASLITDHTIYFSTPQQFNDPWDCKPWFNVPNDPAGRERIIQWFDKVSRKYDPTPNEALRAREIQRLRENPDLLRTKIEEVSSAIGSELARRYRLYCLTSRPACPLMWAHYADKHRGVCLELDVWQEDLCSAIKVEYRDRYPTFRLDDDTDIFPFFTKSSDWRYEDEYRLIAEEEGGAFSDGTLKTRNGLYRLPSGTLKSIVVGAQATENTRAQIRDVISRSGASVTVREARCLPDRYQLAITPPLDPRLGSSKYEPMMSQLITRAERWLQSR